VKRSQRSIGLLLMLASAVACAQTAKLSGHVQDRSGANLAGADVSVKIGNHEVVHESTDANGLFSFDGDAGTYDVSISLQKYVPLKSAMVTFQAGKPETIVLKAEGAAGEDLEYGVFVQGGNALTEDEGGIHFLLAGLHAGKVLTPDVGPGVLHGNFEYAVEIIPFWQSYTPKTQRNMCILVAGTTSTYSCSPPYTIGGTFTGVSVTPIILRWNLTGGKNKKWMPWAQGAGGVIWTNHKYPAFGGPPFVAGVSGPIGNNLPNDDTSVWNFTPQFGIGTHYFFKPKRSIDFSANAVHISSASLGDKNPGINASVQVSVGYTWWK
jgi:lipid A 3-O-deacylase